MLCVAASSYFFILTGIELKCHCSETRWAAWAVDEFWRLIERVLTPLIQCSFCTLCKQSHQPPSTKSWCRCLCTAEESCLTSGTLRRHPGAAAYSSAAVSINPQKSSVWSKISLQHIFRPRRQTSCVQRWYVGNIQDSPKGWWRQLQRPVECSCQALYLQNYRNISKMLLLLSFLFLWSPKRMIMEQVHVSIIPITCRTWTYLNRDNSLWVPRWKRKIRLERACPNPLSYIRRSKRRSTRYSWCQQNLDYSMTVVSRGDQVGLVVDLEAHCEWFSSNMRLLWLRNVFWSEQGSACESSEDNC